MVSFYNIKVENGIVTAHAVNETNGVEEDVIGHELDDLTNAVDPKIRKAIWSLMIRYQGKKKGYPKQTTVAWY